MLKIIDKYILAQFVRNLLFSLLCFIMIFILVDLFENLDKFIDNRLSFRLVAYYYMYFIPEIVRLVAPISVLLSTLFTAGRMMNFNEIVAVKNAGVSLMRFMYPFLLAGVIITAFAMYFNNWIVPEANKQKFSFEKTFLGKSKSVVGLGNLYFQDSPNQLVILGDFKETELCAYKVSVLKFNPDTLETLIERVDAEKLKWENNRWVFYEAAERQFSSGAEKMNKYAVSNADDITALNKINLKPGQITKKQWKPDEMNYTELKEFVDSQVQGGQNTDRLKVDFYSKISFPFSNLIVIIFGISISTGTKRRKGLAMQFGISILVSFVYLGFVKISQSFGYNGDLNPVFTAWMANLIFAGFGAVNLYFRNY